MGDFMSFHDIQVLRKFHMHGHSSIGPEIINPDVMCAAYLVNRQCCIFDFTDKVFRGNLSHDIVQIILCNFKSCFKNHQAYYQTNYGIQLRITQICNYNAKENAYRGYDVHPLMLAICNNRRAFYLPSKIDDILAHCEIHNNADYCHACSKIAWSGDYASEEKLFNSTPENFITYK